MTQKLKCLEFFSGIGGMHFALRAVPDLEFEVLEAFDINVNANVTYEWNFGKKPKAINIEHLSIAQYEQYNADCWLMSPPCQPFTRGGNELDTNDARSKGLLFLIELFGKISNPPRFVFVENVVGFEKSKCRDLLVRQLKLLNYNVCEYMVSPLDPVVAIPNARMRYYLSASRDENVMTSEELLTANTREELLTAMTGEELLTAMTGEKLLTTIPHSPGKNLPILKPLSTYLDRDWDQHDKWVQFQVPSEYILKTKNFRFGIRIF